MLRFLFRLGNACLILRSNCEKLSGTQNLLHRGNSLLRYQLSLDLVLILCRFPNLYISHTFGKGKEDKNEVLI